MCDKHEPETGHKNLGKHVDKATDNAEKSAARALGSDLNNDQDHKLVQYLKQHHLKVAETTVNSQFGPCLIVEGKENGHNVKFEIYGNKQQEKEHGLHWKVGANGQATVTFGDGTTISGDGDIKDSSGNLLLGGAPDSPDNLTTTRERERIAREREASTLAVSGLSFDSRDAIESSISQLSSLIGSTGSASPLIGTLQTKLAAMLGNTDHSQTNPAQQTQQIGQQAQLQIA